MIDQRIRLRTLAATALGICAAGNIQAADTAFDLTAAFENAGRLTAAARQARPILASDIIREDRWNQFASPDPDAIKMLKARLGPNDATALVKIVPPAALTEMLARASTAGSDYLDVLTDSALRGDRRYLATPEGVRVLDDKFVTGVALPYSGRASDGRPFQMTAIIGGAGRIDFLYDLTGGFEFSSDGNFFRIEPGGRVSARIAGPGVLDGITGASVQGCLGIFCRWVSFSKWQKEARRVHLWLTSGAKTYERYADLAPIRRK